MGRRKLDMSDLIDSNLDLVMFLFERDLVRYMKRSMFQLCLSSKSSVYFHLCLQGDWRSFLVNTSNNQSLS